MDWVLEHALDRHRWSQEVNKTTDWEALSSNGGTLPNSEPSDDSELFEVIVDHSRNKENVGYYGVLDDNWCVWGIEKFHSIWVNMSLDSLIMDWNVDLETLEEINYHEDHNGNQDVVKVSKSFSKETLSNGIEFVWLVFQIRKEGYKGTDVLISVLDKREGLPKEIFTEISGNEKRDGWD